MHFNQCDYLCDISILSIGVVHVHFCNILTEIEVGYRSFLCKQTLTKLSTIMLANFPDLSPHCLPRSPMGRTSTTSMIHNLSRHEE